jgi:hypothetical protein
MNRGPISGQSTQTKSFLEKATDAYGQPLPDWILQLANLADTVGLSGCEKRINYSRSAISSVLNGKYAKGDMGRFESMVRGALMAETVECPVLGQIGRDRCLNEQNEPFRATSSFRAQLYHACRGGCVNARKVGQDA